MGFRSFTQKVTFILLNFAMSENNFHETKFGFSFENNFFDLFYRLNNFYTEEFYLDFFFKFSPNIPSEQIVTAGKGTFVTGKAVVVTVVKTWFACQSETIKAQ